MSFIGTLSQTLTLRAAFCPPPISICCRKYPAPLVSIPLTPFSRGRSGPTGFPSPRWLSLPASSGPASDDALLILRSVLFRYVMQLGQMLTLRAAFASSTYLLSQRGGQNRLFCLRRWIHVCKYGLSAHVMLFLNCHVGKSGLFAPVDES